MTIQYCYVLSSSACKPQTKDTASFSGPNKQKRKTTRVFEAYFWCRSCNTGQRRRRQVSISILGSRCCTLLNGHLGRMRYTRCMLPRRNACNIPVNHFRPLVKRTESSRHEITLTSFLRMHKGQNTLF